MKKKIKIGIIGCGRVTEHYHNIISTKIDRSKFKIHVVCDKKKNNLNKFVKLFNCKGYYDYKKMISENSLDIVFVLTPSGSHYQIVKFLLKNKINVLCEKPLTLLLNQTLELEKLAKKNKVILSVAFQNRLNPAVVFLKKCLDEKKLGKIVKASISLLWCRYQNYYEDDWHGSWKMDGGVINQQAIHYIDILRWLFGPVNEVFCYMGNRINRLEAEDTAVATLKFNNGSFGTIEATTAARPVDIHASLSVVGSKGTIVLSGLALNKISRIIGFKNPNKIIKKNSEYIKNGYGKSHYKLINQIIKDVQKNKSSSIIGAGESYKTSALIHAMYSSYEKNKPIKLNSNSTSKRLGK
jgi:predicted dehydrogenase